VFDLFEELLIALICSKSSSS